MGAIEFDAAIEWAVENEIQFYIFDLVRLRQAVTAAKKVGKKARIHLEVETGLNRMGLTDEQLTAAIPLIKNENDSLTVEGVCTHYAGAESVANYVRIQKQLESFTLICARLEREGVEFKRRHTACSAAVLRYPETHMDMVRVGIAQYGFWPNKETEMDYQLRHGHFKRPQMVRTLRRVLRWSSRIMNIKTLGPGEFVGYGNSYMTTGTQRIASVPVGYFHGFTRGLSNLGMVLVHGRRAQVVGLVNMNMMMVDVTHVPNAAKGDEVVIIGRQNKAHIDVASFSDLTRVLNYEVLVRLPSEIPRVVVR
jgi:alanine racemase